MNKLAVSKHNCFNCGNLLILQSEEYYYLAKEIICAICKEKYRLVPYEDVNDTYWVLEEI